MNNKALWIFPNIREVINKIEDQAQRDTTWRIIIEYAFGEENDISEYPMAVRMSFEALKPFLQLRKRGGSINGKSNNPNGRPKKVENSVGKTTLDNKLTTLDNKLTTLDKLPEWLSDILQGKTPPLDLCDCDSEIRPIYEKINPFVNQFLTDPSANKSELLKKITKILEKPVAIPKKYITLGEDKLVRLTPEENKRVMARFDTACGLPCPSWRYVKAIRIVNAWLASGTTATKRYKPEQSHYALFATNGWVWNEVNSLKDPDENYWGELKQKYLNDINFREDVDEN